MRRYTAYVAIMALVGIILTDLFVWPGSAHQPVARRVLFGAHLAIVMTAMLHLLVLSSDVGGRTVPSLRDFETAGRTAAGAALLIRVIVAAVTWLLLRRAQFTHADVRWSTLGLTGVALMATWAFAGHSASQLGHTSEYRSM